MVSDEITPGDYSTLLGLSWLMMSPNCWFPRISEAKDVLYVWYWHIKIFLTKLFDILKFFLLCLLWVDSSFERTPRGRCNLVVEKKSRLDLYFKVPPKPTHQIRVFQVQASSKMSVWSMSSQAQKVPEILQIYHILVSQLI